MRPLAQSVVTEVPESAGWVALAVLAPAAIQLLWRRLRVPAWQPYLDSLAPWLYGIGPAYLALITGAVRARHFGLAGRPALVWAAGLVFCSAWLLVSARWLKPAGRWPKPARGVLDEPRWALYRAAAAGWIGSPPLGALLGLGLAAGELGLGWVARPGQKALPWEALARAASSSVLFVLTGNFWLTLVAQGMALFLLRGRRL